MPELIQLISQKVNTRLFPLILTLAFLLLSCAPKQTLLPFSLYGTTITDATYCTMDGLPQKMDIYFPDAAGPWPVLVYVHGGSWMVGDKSEAVVLGRDMRAQGYAVVSLNYRLYPAVRFPQMIEDVKCAIRSLRAHADQFNLDANHIAAMGASAGGHLVALLGTSDKTDGWDVGEYLDQSSRVQAVIAMAPATDFSKKFMNTDIQTLVLVAFGDANIAAASPITHITSDDPPFLLIHGDQDSVLPFEQSQLMYDKLKETGVAAQFVVVENGDHTLTAPDGSAKPTTGEINQIISDFLAANLK
jgi:acetyl esterase/lipase